jgi:hypothetical protein
MGDEAGNAWPVLMRVLNCLALLETGLSFLIISTPAEGAVSVRTHPQISDFFFKKGGNDSSG